MRKAVPGKASSTRLSISQKGGGGGRKGALEESPENLQQVRCYAGPRRWLSPQLGRLGIKGADTSSLARGLETQISLLPFLLPSFQPSLPFVHIFLQFCRNCILYILFPLYISFAISFSFLTYLLCKCFGVSSICPDLSFRFQNTVFNMQLIYQQEVRDTLTKITPGSYRQVRQVSVKSKIIMKINEYLSDCNSLLLSIIISALTDNFLKKI